MDLSINMYIILEVGKVLRESQNGVTMENKIYKDLDRSVCTDMEKYKPIIKQRKGIE